MFILEIEYLMGVMFSSEFHNPRSAEWPPHPDRLFLAFIASWGRTKDVEGANALRWLESQDHPEIFFPDVDYRSNFQSYVPASGNSEKTREIFNKSSIIFDIHASLLKKPRYFPAVVFPNNAQKICFVWKNSEPSKNTRDKLSDLAHQISYLGHSASFVRITIPLELDCKFSHRYVCDENGGGDYFLRCPYKGRFDDVTSKFDEHGKNSNSVFRPNKSQTYKYREYAKEQICSLMGNEWIILSSQGDYIPNFEIFPLIAKKMRNAIMHHTNDPIHELISGHNEDGAPLQKPHLAILPMANIGWKYSDGSLMGIALVLPRASKYGTDERKQLMRSLNLFLNDNDSKGIGTLKIDQFGTMKLKHSTIDRHSLFPDRYIDQSKIWATVTPIILDQYPKKKKGPKEIIAESCKRIGLPQPASVQVSRHSPIIAAPSAYLAKNSNGWATPKKGLFDGRYICHAIITFDENVLGPVIIGSGRYYGMGLCIPHKIKGDM